MQWNSKTHLHPIHAVNKNMRHLETAFFADERQNLPYRTSASYCGAIDVSGISLNRMANKIVIIKSIT